MPDEPSSESGPAPTIEQDGITLTRRAGVPVLANFRLLQKLGEGGMGYVYKAEDVIIQKPVALKILHKHYAEKPEFLSRFHQEARAAGKLSHPNIVSAVSTGEANGHVYYVMEFCEGEPLDKWLAREKVMPWRQALELAGQVAQGLEHAHQHGIVHRDIKPANIMMMPDGKAKVLDFGLAKNVMGLEDVCTEQRGVAWGTPNYISPEQGRSDKQIGPVADIYSLGATLFHLVTGQTPFQGTGRELVKKHLFQNIPDPRSIRPDLPPAVTCLLVTMMAKLPAQRYADCGHLWVAIKLALEGHPPTFAAVYAEKTRLARVPAKAPTEPVAAAGDELQLIPAGPSKVKPLVPGSVVPLGTRDEAPRPRSRWAWAALPLLLAAAGGLAYWALAGRNPRTAASLPAKAEPAPTPQEAPDARKAAPPPPDGKRIAELEAKLKEIVAERDAERREAQAEKDREQERQKQEKEAEEARKPQAQPGEEAKKDDQEAKKKEEARPPDREKTEQPAEAQERPEVTAKAKALEQATLERAAARQRLEAADAAYKRAEEARRRSESALLKLKGLSVALSGQYEAAQFERDTSTLSRLRRAADDLNRQTATANRDATAARDEVTKARLAWVKAQQEDQAAQERGDLARKAEAVVKPGGDTASPEGGGTGASAVEATASLDSRFTTELRRLVANRELGKAEPELRTLAARAEFASARESLEARLKDFALAASFEQDGLKALAASKGEMALPEELAQKWKTPAVKVTGYDPARGLSVNAGGASFDIPVCNTPASLVAESAGKKGRELAAALYLLLRGQLWEARALLPGLAEADRFRVQSWLTLVQNTPAEAGATRGSESAAKAVPPPPAPPKEFSQFKLSKLRYGEKDDLNAAIAREFGQGHRLADWNDVLQYKDRIASFADAVGLVENQDVLISRDGQRLLGARRHYILSRHNQRRPPDWSVRDTIDGNLIDLGLGYNLNVPVLAIRDEAVRTPPHSGGGRTRY